MSRRNVPPFYKLAEWWWLALSQESPKASDYDTLCKLWHLLPGAQTETASQHISRALLRRLWAEMLFLPSPCKSLCLLFRLRTWGEIGCANENEFLQNPMYCKCHHKELHTCFFCYVLKLDESCWVWIIFLSALYCPLLGLWAALSLHERNNLKWRNTSMSPFPPRVIIQLIFFPTSGSLYRSSNNNLSWLLVPLQQSCGETRGKVLCFMIYGGYLTCAY